MNKIRTIMAKEWADVTRNRLVFYVIVFLPLFMTILPLVMLFVMGRIPPDAGDLQELGRVMRNPLFAGLTAAEAVQSVLASNFLTLFLMMPLMVPVTIAAYSIVGEKVQRSLEPLLATPVTTTQLLLGKGLAAALPGIVMSWVCYGLFLIFSRYLVVSERVYAVFTNPMWFVALFVLGPLLTVMAVNVGVIVSSRTTDPRAAEQLGSLVILPVLILFLGPLTGLISLNSNLFWVTSALVLVLDIVLVYIGVRLFRRETILTRWK